MSPSAITCPTQQQLAAFAAGKLDDAFSGEIEQHLGECPSCCQLLKLLPDDNTLVSLLRDPRAETTADDPLPSSPGVAPTILPAREQLTTPPGVGATEFAVGDGSGGQVALPAALAHHARYRITRLLGRGGMGDVFQAHHRMMNRTVALKVISAQLVSSPAAVERFHREVQAAARLSHPNIVAAYDAEQAGDVHFLAMEFVEGADLATLVQENGPLPVAQACDFIRQAADGLRHAHGLGMVHRDIKPQNLMVAGGIVKILDFGLASFATESAAEQIEQSPDRHEAGPAAHLTLMGSMMGTPDFMAPEQARDAHSADIRSDIYSLGCTLHFLLTGQPPFSGESVLDKVMAHVEREPKPLSECRKDVPIGMEAVVRRMMAKDPAERFQTPADVVAAIKSLSVPQPLPRRRRSLAGPLTVAATLLVGFFLALATVIVVVTDRGRLIIQSEVSDVQIVVKEDGKVIETIDLKTGSQVTWLPTGKYELELVGGENDVKIDRSGFTMSRLGQAIVTARYSDEGHGVIRAFGTTEPTITRDGVEVADGGWKLTATAPRTVRLFDTPMPPMKPGPYFYRAKLKSENVTGRAYLEMWSRFPGEGEFFSKGFDKALKGTNGWAECEVPFYLKKGEQPDLVRLNVAIEGSGTVWIKDIEIRGRTAANDLADLSTGATVSDQQRLQGKWAAVSATFRGKKLTVEQLARLSITLAGDRAELTDPDSGQAMAGTFAIDASRSPKHIDFIAPDGKERAPGIFEFDGERLKVAFVDSDYARPTDFQPADTPDHMTGVFERVPGSGPAAVPREEPVAPLELDETQQEAVKAAEAYLAVMDEGRFGQLRDMLSSLAKRGATREQISQANQKLRDTFGKAQRRVLRRVQLYDEFPGLPDGRYAAVQYKSDFERQNGLWESLVLNLDADGQWRVNTYANTLEPLPFPDATKPAAGNQNPQQRKTGILTSPPSLPAGGLPIGKNLIADPSLEETRTGELPKTWSAWLNDGPDFKCEVVEGSVTGKHCLQISGTGTRGVVFATSIPLDRTKRYALKGRVKVEGEAGTWAVVKLNYFNKDGWLGVDDRIGVTTSDLDWKLLEKTDASEKYPTATLIVPTCHLEGNGTAWFDDLEVIAYDRDKLPDDFDATHGKNNRMN